MGKKIKRVRLQINMENEYLKEINELAARMGLTQSGMSELLLEEALISHTQIAEWLTLRIAGKVANVVRGRKIRKTNQKTYLQVLVNEDVAKKLDVISGDINQTCVKFAALLLESAIEDHEWIIKCVTTPFVKKLYQGLSGKKLKDKEIMKIIGENMITD